MNIGAVMLIGYLLYRFTKKKNADTVEVDRTVRVSEYSFRTVILSVLTILAYFALVFGVITVYLCRIRTGSAWFGFVKVVFLLSVSFSPLFWYAAGRRGWRGGYSAI